MMNELLLAVFKTVVGELLSFGLFSLIKVTALEFFIQY